MAKTKISDPDFAKLLTQSKLVLTPAEKSKIHSQLDEAIQAIQVLGELDTSHLDQASSASGLTNVWRDDVVTPSLSPAEALQNSAHSHAGYFLVPSIFEPKDT